MSSTKREWLDEPTTAVTVVMLVVILAFGAFVAYLIVREVRADDAFRARCKDRGGIVISEDADTTRICVHVENGNQVIIDIER